MSVAKAVKEAIESGSGDYWMLNLPDEMKAAYYGGTNMLRRENRDERSDFVTLKIAARLLSEQGIRGLCFR